MIVSQVVIHATGSLCVISAILTAVILILLLARRPSPLSAGTWATSAAALVLAAAFLVWGYAASAPPAPEAAYAEALAKHLTATGAKFYGAYWCPHCTDQKKMFGKAVGLLPYIECDPRSPIGKPAVCAAAGIRAFPTWDIGGTRREGVLSFDELAKLSGFKAPPQISGPNRIPAGGPSGYAGPGGLPMTFSGVEKDFGAICGLYWKGSAWYEVLGGTCATQGEANLGKICPVYSCARDHQVEHCGLCPEFPCILLVHMASLHNDDRISSAAVRAEIGNDLWAAWAGDQRLWTTAFCPLRTAT